jgi:septal ring factor EnvC (AmiA/AmiB activator)
MAKKKAAKKTPSPDRRLANIERLVRAGFQQVDRRFTQVERHLSQVDRRLDQVDQRFAQIDRQLDLLELGQRDLRAEMNEKFALIEERINVPANHVDGFIKLHETLDIDSKSLKNR